MLRDRQGGAIQSDAYIDALLAGHARLPISLPVGKHSPVPSVRHVIRLLERGLPRVHPSFLFEERLAEQLRTAHADPGSAAMVFDRRLLFGGALAGGVSIAGAAMIAWRRLRD